MYDDEYVLQELCVLCETVNKGESVQGRTVSIFPFSLRFEK